MTISSWFHNLETEAGIIAVDINAVIGKLISGIELVGNEVDALLKWTVSQSANIEAGLNAAAPIIAAVTGLATAAATGNPAAGVAVNAAINGVNKAFNAAQAAVNAMNAAKASLTASGGGSLSNDTAAVVAGVHAITAANSTVANISTAALSAAQSIQALIPAKVAPLVGDQLPPVKEPVPPVAS